MILLALFLAGGAVALQLHQTSRRAEEAFLQPPDRAVIFVVQGASPAILADARLQNIQAMERNGIVFDHAWAGQVPTFPPVSIASLMTGRVPAHHGILGPQWLDVRHSRILSPPRSPKSPLWSHIQNSLPALVRSSYKGARVLAVGGVGCQAASAAGVGRATTTICPVAFHGKWVPEVVNNVSGSGFIPSNARVPVSHVGPGGKIEGWPMGRQDAWIARVASQGVRALHPRLTVVCFPELETVAPWLPATGRTARLQQIAQGIDRGIGQIMNSLRQAGLGDRTVFVVTSDRSLEPTSRHINLAALEARIFASGGERVYAAGDGALFVGLRDPLQAVPAAQALASHASKNIDAIYYKTHVNKAWRYHLQYVSRALSARAQRSTRQLLATLASVNAPDLVIDLKPGVATAMPRSGTFRRAAAGISLLWTTQKIPLLISGHGVHPGITASFPAELRDVAPTLARMLQIRRLPSDGMVLADPLLRPTSADIKSQVNAARRRNQLLRPLMGRASGVPALF